MTHHRDHRSRRLAAFVAGAAASLAVATTALAQQAGSSADHARHGKDAHAGQGAPAAAMAEGEVRRVDRDAGKLTIRHGEIRNLDMPPMTMVFRVADPALLEKAAEGAKIRFAAEKRGADYVVTAIEPR